MDYGFVLINHKAPFPSLSFFFISQRLAEKGKKNCFTVRKVMQFSGFYGSPCGHWHKKYEKGQEKKVDGWLLNRER